MNSGNVVRFLFRDAKSRMSAEHRIIEYEVNDLVFNVERFWDLGL